ncbi:hypothetical protein EI94DRAFT_1810470 [Lactarius quietus]|nr:hypothetical protein EI94DRAFT_1810470 [Lactarius quietus]
MQIESGFSFKIVNKMAGLALQLSADDQKSIIGERVFPFPLEAQIWTIERVDDGFLIISKANGKYIGTEFSPLEGVKLVVVDRGDAKVWNIRRDSPPNFMIGLREFPFVIEFPISNLKPGTKAQLGPAFPEDNRLWILTQVDN